MSAPVQVAERAVAHVAIVVYLNHITVWSAVAPRPSARLVAIASAKSAVIKA